MKTGYNRVGEVRDSRLAELLKELVDDGEAEAITLALEGVDVLPIDERDGRDLAKRLGLQVMGMLAVIAIAKYRGLIPEVKPIVDRLMERGYWVSRKVLGGFLEEIGEH